MLRTRAEIDAEPRTISVREFAQMVLPVYRRERWRWYKPGVQKGLVVPSQLRIERSIRALMEASSKRWSKTGWRSGGIQARRKTGSVFEVTMYPQKSARWIVADVRMEHRKPSLKVVVG